MDILNSLWFDQQLQSNPDLEKFRQNPIAYFCAEFALSDMMPGYSGGLGVLAGDLIKEANELGIPLVGIGLLYKKGFFKQDINDNDEQTEEPQPINPRSAGLSLVLNSEGAVLIQSIPIKEREVFFQIWRLKVGVIDMYFLDTDIQANSEEDRQITAQLYGGDKNTRILQEIVLGIGGEKTLYKQGIYPSVYHMNEGHSAFAAFGIVHHCMRNEKISYEEAFEKVHKKLVFTNHTLVPAGNDVFEKELVEEHLAAYAKDENIPLDDFVQKGLTEDGHSFSMTIFALNLALKTNAVSVLHAQKAKELWPNYDMLAVTNGVNIKTWLTPTLYNHMLDIALHNNLPLEEATNFLSKGEIWQMHQQAKEALVKQIFTITGSIFDKEIMTVTWARRIASYKRPDLIFLDIERIKRIITNIQKPVQFIIAGKPHPQDAEGKAILHNILTSIKKLNEPNRIIFLPNYSLSLAQALVSGSDVWLNNPIRGEEASGTSGMKAGANGVLQFTIKDGWTDEVDWNETGWVIDDADASQSLYSQLENDITSMYYKRLNDLPEEWIERMINTMTLCISQYSSKRMLIDYVNKMYLPSLQAQEDIHA